MKIVSTTITNNRPDVIGAALETIAPEVDTCVVIDTGVTDNTMELARQACGSKFSPRKFKWVDDFAAARNYSLALGKLEDADWIIQADTDERLKLPGLRDVLARVPPRVDVVMVPHGSGTYRQSRIVRATSKARWHMPVHEYLAPTTPTIAPEGWVFECQPRPTEDLTAKYEYYCRLLEKWTAQQPKDPRGWYYLGDTLSILKRTQEAIDAFLHCGKLPGWSEQAAWAHFRAALLQNNELEKPELALETCIKGICRDASIGELFWLAGFLCYHQDNHQAAKSFAEAALKVADKPRTGFQWPAARKALPEELLAWARVQLGEDPADVGLRAAEPPR